MEKDFDLKEFFDRHSDAEYLKFDRVENPLHARPDIHAFLLLDMLAPEPGRNMVCSACHDKFYLEPYPDKVLATATEENLIDLIRCGVMYSEEDESFWMFS